MDSVAAAEYPPPGIPRHVRLIDVPDRRPHDLRFDRRIPDQYPDLFANAAFGEIRITLIDVEPPAGDPLRPRPHGPEKAHPDFAEARVGRDNPVQDAGTMFAVPGEVGVEDGVDGARTRHAPFDRKLEMIDDGRSRAVGTDHVACPDGEFPSVQPIAQRGGDAVGILLMADIFGVERKRRALFGGLLKQDGFEQRLDDVHHAARTCPKVVPSSVVPGAPRPHPDEFGPGQAGGERGVTHQFPWARVPGHVFRNSEITEALVGSLVGDVRARAICHPVDARHDVASHAAIRERKGRR